VLEYELTPAGRELLFVAKALDRWLAQAPGGPAPLGGSTAKGAIKALVDGWSATMVRALSAGPLMLTELDGVIGAYSYPALERRLASMRLAGLVEAHAGTSRGRPYAVSNWLRRSVAPLATAIRWERSNLADRTATLCRIDIEAAFLLALPLATMPNATAGRCRLAMEVANGQRLAGVVTTIEDGAVRSCDTRIDGDADAWALGGPAAWLMALIEGDVSGLEVGGDGRLAKAVIGGVHQGLFVTQVETYT
jgi:DNA-binding HxlR family transcriptional regulator